MSPQAWDVLFKVLRGIWRKITTVWWVSSMINSLNAFSQNIYKFITYIFYELFTWICATQFVIKQEFNSQYAYNKHDNTPWEVYAYSVLHSLVCIRNLTRSLRSLVRFPILDQLVRKYHTHTLSMKYSRRNIVYRVHNFSEFQQQKRRFFQKHAHCHCQLLFIICASH